MYVCMYVCMHACAHDRHVCERESKENHVHNYNGLVYSRTSLQGTNVLWREVVLFLEVTNVLSLLEVEILEFFKGSTIGGSTLCSFLVLYASLVSPDSQEKSGGRVRERLRYVTPTLN